MAKSSSPDLTSELREQAETKLKKGGPVLPPDLSALTPEEYERLVYELHVYQIELEMQNEALRAAQEELEQARQRYADLYDFAPVGYFVFDNRGTILEVNLTGAQQLGVERSQLINQPFNRYLVSQYRDRFYRHCRAALERAARQQSEFKLLRSDGSAFWGLLDTVPVSGSNNLVRTVITDLTGRKEVEEALEISATISYAITEILDLETLLATIVTLIQKSFHYELVWLSRVDPADNSLVVQAAAGSGAKALKPGQRRSIDQTILASLARGEKSRLINIPDQSGAPPQAQAMLEVLLARRDQLEGVLTIQEPAQQAFTRHDVLAVEALSHHIVTALENARLFSDLKAAQAQLVENERLAAVGQVAAVVAHELRNPVMGVRLGVDYLLHRLPGDESCQRAATLVQANMERIDHVVEDILFITRKPQPLLIPGLLRPVLEKEITRWEFMFSSKQVSYQLDLAEGLPPLPLDAGQMGLAVSNLISNSLDALPPGGELRLSLAAAGPNQVITLTDNGFGIPLEQLAHVFEPFFTTKKQGTGLGLAIVKQIVEQHHGQVAVWSEVGQGSRFTITLPGS